MKKIGLRTAIKILGGTEIVIHTSPSVDREKFGTFNLDGVRHEFTYFPAGGYAGLPPMVVRRSDDENAVNRWNFLDRLFDLGYYLA